MPGAGQHRTAALIGERSLLIRCAEILVANGVEIAVVASSADDVGQWCASSQTPLIVSGPGLAERLQPFSFDYLFSITNLSVLPAEVLDMASTMAINFHDGPLPAYAGLHATSWALLAGETRHGVSWHVMEPAVDRGDLLQQAIFDVAEDETAQSLNITCYEQAISTFERLVADLVDDRLDRQPQTEAGRSYFGRKQRPAGAGTVAWTDPVAAIDRLVRALDFGLYENPLARAKVLIGERLFAIDRLDVTTGETGAAPGTITAVDGPSITVAAADGSVTLHGLSATDRVEHTPARAAADAGLSVGDRLRVLTAQEADELATAAGDLAASEAAWVDALEQLVAVEVPTMRHHGHLDRSGWSAKPLEIPAGSATLGGVVGVFASFVARLCDAATVDLALTGPEQVSVGQQPWFASQVPLRCQIAADHTVESVMASVSDDLDRARGRRTFASDLPLRYPQLQSVALPGAGVALAVPVGVVIGGDPTRIDPTLPQGLLLHVDEVGASARLLIDRSAFTDAAADRMHQRLQAYLVAALAQPSRLVSDTTSLTEDEHRTVTRDWNDTVSPAPTTPVPELFRAAAQRRPDATAVVGGDLTLTYAELDERSDQLAAQLLQLGLSTDDRVGIMVNRGAHMVVGLLGILKAGGAYVPLDPTYPSDRLAFMADDAGLSVLLVDDNTRSQAPASSGQLLVLGTDGTSSADSPGPVAPQPSGAVGLDDLAYVIYTSGSTGRPKGVMVTHGNLVNFLDGMDRHIDHEETSTWLTVTSLSFDISLLEIFWSLTRGIELVVHDAEAELEGAGAPAVAPLPPGTDPMGFSLFYFASDESDAGSSNKYRLLLEGARFADEHGFEAVWTPERHFHAFGGLYPNPAVTAAAIAASTTRVDVRAGSCVLPLHHPIRVAEEWSVVDNLSNGRVGIAFASGWQPDDFVLRPENFADRKEAMLRDIDAVQRLWRGEELTFDGPKGPSSTRILPRPVQDELPTWITAAGNPATYEAAGAGGHNILTHLLGQSVDEVAEKIELYRKARRAAGHEGPGRVTLMLHTHLGHDIARVKEQVRPSMKQYLRSSVDLIKEAAWSFPTFTQQEAETGTNPVTTFDEQGLSEEEMDALVEHAFERYFDGSALFGTVESCTDLVRRLQAVGVDEIACQIDFGLPVDEVIDALPLLDQLRQRMAELATGAIDGPVDRSIPALIERHQVTHFQCTPSMGTMLVANDAFRRVAPRLKVWLMGGEAFPQKLAEQALDLVDGGLVNVYGPTETTIWSSASPITDPAEPVTIGRPLTNQQLYVVDANLDPCPIGKPGELLIGGDGVTRGYLGRPELTDERFIPDHFRPDVPGATLYRTGDLVRHDDDGQIVFIGRMDLQVKVRGYRIELGEIETQLQQHPSVNDAVVMAREDRPGDQQLVGYVIAQPGATPDADDLRTHLERSLPVFMVPSRFVVMDRFPLTPNKKTDRMALPPPTAENTGTSRPGSATTTPTEGTEGALAKIWQDLLSLDQVGLEDNFFDLGGHSLLAVQLNRMIEQELGTELSITDVFRYPTVAALAARLDGSNGTSQARAEQSATRASNRRRALAGRRRPNLG